MLDYMVWKKNLVYKEINFRLLFQFSSLLTVYISLTLFSTPANVYSTGTRSTIKPSTQKIPTRPVYCYYNYSLGNNCDAVWTRTKLCRVDCLPPSPWCLRSRAFSWPGHLSH